MKLPSQFAALVPKVREFLETKAFGEPGRPGHAGDDQGHRQQRRAVRDGQDVRAGAAQGLVVEELEPQLLNAGRRLSETPPFPWSRPTLAAAKCVFNLVPCDNEFEKEFARFLQDATDVERFAKLPEQFGFVIEYTDASGNLRYYEPDFVAVTADGTNYLIETKGLEDVNVASKDRAATLWCENATLLTGQAVAVPEGAADGVQQPAADGVCGCTRFGFAVAPRPHERSLVVVSDEDDTVDIGI